MTYRRTTLQRSHPGRPLDLSPILSDLALLATAGSVLLLFAVSPVTLESLGIPYLTSGGGIFSKLHPSTILAILALAMRCLAARKPLRKAFDIATCDPGVVLMTGACAITASYAVLISHTPVTPMIDTLALPILIFLLLRDLDPVCLKWLAIGVILIFCVNAVLAILEVVEHKHFPAISVAFDASADPTRADGTFDWRAQLANDRRSVALLGHPLTGGLLTGALAICLVSAGSRWIPTFVKVPVMILQALAMGTFGARTAFVLTVVAIFGLGVAGGVDAVRRGRRLTPGTAAVVLLVLGLLFVGTFVIFDLGLADQTIDRFQHDSGSAVTRVRMFDLFSPLSVSDILLGPDPEVVATQQRLQGLEFGIESSWVGFALSYGLVVTAIILTGILAFTRSILKASGRGAGIVMLFFYIQVSTAASLSTKTTLLAMTTALLMIVLQKDKTIGLYPISGAA